MSTDSADTPAVDPLLRSDDPASDPRRYLVAALTAARPEDPTLCEGWQARHLAAHIVVREGPLLPALRAGLSGSDPAVDLGDQVQDLADYEALTARVAAGPGRFSPHRLPPMVTGNVTEFLVHAMDVRRGAIQLDPALAPDPATGAVLGPRLARALWTSVGLMGRLRYRGAGPVGVIAVVPGGPRRVLRRGRHSVVLTGSELELALVVTGRERGSLATLSGPPEAVAQFRAAGLWRERD